MAERPPTGPENGNGESEMPNACSYASRIQALRVLTSSTMLARPETRPAEAQLRLLRRQQILMAGQLIIMNCQSCVLAPDPEPGQAWEYTPVPFAEDQAPVRPGGAPRCPNATRLDEIAAQAERMR